MCWAGHLWPPFFCSPFLLPEIKLTRDSRTQGHSSMGATQKLPKRARVAGWTLKPPPPHQLCTLGPAASLGGDHDRSGRGKEELSTEPSSNKKGAKVKPWRTPAGRGLRAARGMEFITGPLWMGPGSMGKFLEDSHLKALKGTCGWVDGSSPTMEPDQQPQQEGTGVGGGHHQLMKLWGNPGPPWPALWPWARAVSLCASVSPSVT